MIWPSFQGCIAIPTGFCASASAGQDPAAREGFGEDQMRTVIGGDLACHVADRGLAGPRFSKGALDRR